MTVIRAEAAADIPAIDRLLRDCFEGDDEAKLVTALRQDDDLSLSLVAEQDGAIIGHVAFSPVLLNDRPQTRCHALAPLAVTGKYRRKGLAARLTETGLAHLRNTGAHGAIVLGSPAYYRRFGFRAELAEGLRCDWSGPYLQALAFDNSTARPTGPLTYAAAFSAVT